MNKSKELNLGNLAKSFGHYFIATFLTFLSIGCNMQTSIHIKILSNIDIAFIMYAINLLNKNFNIPFLFFLMVTKESFEFLNYGSLMICFFATLLIKNKVLKLNFFKIFRIFEQSSPKSYQVCIISFLILKYSIEKTSSYDSIVILFFQIVFYVFIYKVFHLFFRKSFKKQQIMSGYFTDHI
jgi:hypothetical protein